MNWRSVRVLYLHEMQMLARDRRTIALAVLLPLLAMPLILYATKRMEEGRKRNLQETVYRYAVTGPGTAEVRRLISAHRQTLLLKKDRKVRPEEDDARFELEEVPLADPAEGLRAHTLHFYLRMLDGREADRLAQEALKDDRGEPPPSARRQPPKDSLLQAPERPPGVPLVQIICEGDRDESGAGRTRMRRFLLDALRTERDRLLRDSGLPLDPEDLFALDDLSVASAAQRTGSQIGKYITLFLIMFLLSGGSVVALDIVAGEKERGSLETLLTTAASRAEIVTAKQTTILTVALVILTIHLANILVYVSFRIIELPEDWVIRISPAAVLALVILFVPVAAFLSAVLLTLSAYAGSYKEAQLYFFPVYLISLVPGVAAVLPRVSLRSPIVLVPLANVSVAAREVLVGRFDWPMLVLALLVMAVSALYTMRASTWMLSSERLTTAASLERADLCRGPALFSRQVLGWYAVMGAVLLAVAVNVPGLSTFRAQLLFNELVLFLGSSLLMVGWYRLDIRQAFALRPVRPVVWPVVLVMIPSGHLVASGVFRLADLAFPVPRQVLEQFARDLLPQDVPGWQMIFFLALLPGICEEIAFRGALLYGLSWRLRPMALVLAVGTIFGLFHVALFRIIPTGFLGMVLTAVALLTGSIFPGMLLHAGNNAWAYWLSQREIPVDRLHWGWHAAALAAFALSLFVLYRWRTPYPGLHNRVVSGGEDA